MKRYKVAVMQKPYGISFIFKGKPYHIKQCHNGIYSGQVPHDYCRFWFRLTDDKGQALDISWQKVKDYNDLENNPEGIELKGRTDDKDLMECFEWLDEQVFEDKEPMEIDDLVTQGKANILKKGE